MTWIRALVDGRWHGSLEATRAVRPRLSEGDTFRGWVVGPGQSAPPGYEPFPAQPGRYHIYVSYACPWAHRAILYRHLKRLEDTVSMSVVNPRMAGPEGWTFRSEDDHLGTRDHANGRSHLYEVYQQANPAATTRVTTPTLWDKAQGQIVSRESGDIMMYL